MKAIILIHKRGPLKGLQQIVASLEFFPQRLKIGDGKRTIPAVKQWEREKYVCYKEV